METLEQIDARIVTVKASVRRLVAQLLAKREERQALRRATASAIADAVVAGDAGTSSGAPPRRAMSQLNDDVESLEDQLRGYRLGFHQLSDARHERAVADAIDELAACDVEGREIEAELGRIAAANKAAGARYQDKSFRQQRASVTRNSQARPAFRSVDIETVEQLVDLVLLHPGLRVALDVGEIADALAKLPQGAERYRLRIVAGAAAIAVTPVPVKDGVPGAMIS
jgi:hypothetical protein